MWQEIGAGNVLNATQVANVVNTVPDNTRVRLTLNLRASPAGWMVDQIQNTLENEGVPGVKVSTGSPVLNISWIHNPAISSGISRISLAPLAIVAIIIVALAAVAISVIGWLVYKDVPTALKPAVIIGGLALVGILAYALIKSELQSRT